jgi:alpha-L-fucosidase
MNPAMRLCLYFLLLFSVLKQHSLLSQTHYQPAKENLEAREWFQNAKFGMFIHWGVYSTLARGEWVMETDKIAVNNYEKLPSFFNPQKFDAKEWVSLAKNAGMKYITITSRHHDGFSMFDSKVTNYDIVDRTPYGKDILKALAAECQKQGIKLFFYYSHLDWHHPDYFPLGKTGHSSERDSGGDWSKYREFMNAQLTELLSNYGPIGGIWFDGWWDNKKAEWNLENQYQLIHKLQPATLIGNNHHQPPFAGEDFQMFEKDLPGHNTTGFSSESKVGALPLETCETMNNSWGFNLQDNKYKSTKSLIHYMVKAAGYNANFLLNIGPMPNGEIQKEFIDTLNKVGEWMSKYGETIYGTRGGPINPHPWGVSTVKGNKCFLHVLDYDDNAILIPPFNKKIKSAKVYKEAKPLTTIDTKEGTLIKLPTNRHDNYDLIIELDI